MNTVSTPTAIKPVDFNTYEKVDGSLVFPELFSKGEVQITRRKFRHQTQLLRRLNLQCLHHY